VRRLDVGDRKEQFGCHMRCAADSDRREVVFAGFFFRERDEFFQIGRRKFRAHQQDLVADRHH
jgi:hypothetical protein